MKKLLIALALAGVTATGLLAKKPLDHDTFNSWEAVRTGALTDNGAWASYTVNPQEGDGRLVLRNVKKGTDIVLPRGYRPQFSADAKWAVALIKPLYEQTRKAKIDKKKDLDLPQDTLAIVNLTTGKVELIPNVLSYRLGREGGDWLAYTTCDTTYVSPKAVKDKKAGKPMILRNLASGVTKVVPWVKEYSISRLGNRLAAYTKPHKSDSLAVDQMLVFNLPDTTPYVALQEQKYYGTPVFSRQEDRMAFVASLDSTESGTRKGKLYTVEMAKLNRQAPGVAEEMYVLQTVNAGKAPHIMRPNTNGMTDEQRQEAIRKTQEKIAALAGDSLYITQHTVPAFSHDGKRLIVGVQKYTAPDDTTIVDFEQPVLDIWRWDAPLTPPQEKSQLSALESSTYPIVIDLADGRETLLTTSEWGTIEAPYRWDGEWALLRDPEGDIIARQWNYTAPEQLYIINVNTGETRKVAQAPSESSSLSPEGKYVYWWDKRNYYVYDIATGQSVCVSEAIDVPLWDEDQDIPMDRQPYGVAGWTAGDKAMWVYDRHDIWALDPTGKTAPVNITKGDGRAKNYRYKYRQTDPEKINFSPGDQLLLNVFDYTTKKNGLGYLKVGAPVAPQVNVLDEYTFYQVSKAKNAPVYTFAKGNFSVIPEVWITPNGDFKSARKLTDVNAQKADYSWGNAQLVKWYAYDGTPVEGVLYTPEDLDPNKKYPMLAVFYERNAEELYAHYTMEPSWSWVNYPFYVSRGYVVFVPDVVYTPGIPGEGAYNCICSGVEYLCDKYPWIDREKIGIDGQSWGGYQTAYLVTRTNMFACAGSGAPVSNMTSAFGGIRWGTGDSRQAQYEVGQSRIGRNLWEAPELYVANSPLFKADRVETPLLIMHNDEDGAVPWYQGIEYFMALRRLGKPVWMLQYNGEAHNIRARKNRKDITHRLQEFFDYYLKGGEMPRWMKEGIPMTRKGQELRYGTSK